MDDLPKLPPLDMTAYAAQLERTIEASHRLWRDVVPEATRRLFHDPLLVARARATAQQIRLDREGAFARTWSRRDQHLAEWAAAIALVVAERPELITGEPPTGVPPVEVIATRIAALADPSRTASHIRDAAAAVLTALALEGYEVTRRADRFASLERDARQVRMPLRGRCGVCGGDVRRHLISSNTEALLGSWFHVDGGGYGHEPAEVVAP